MGSSLSARELKSKQTDKRHSEADIKQLIKYTLRTFREHVRSCCNCLADRLVKKVDLGFFPEPFEERALFTASESLVEFGNKGRVLLQLPFGLPAT